MWPLYETGFHSKTISFHAICLEIATFLMLNQPATLTLTETFNAKDQVVVVWGVVTFCCVHMQFCKKLEEFEEVGQGDQMRNIISEINS